MESKQQSQSITHQILIKLLNGKHKALNFTSPIVPIETLKQTIQTLTLIPSDLQLLTLSNSRILDDSQSLNLCSGSGFNGSGRSFAVVVHLLLRLRGGKGGFGSLLRGAATKAGQKKTNNFDACRDMSGRRLRHVNAEKKLEEWRAEAEERKLEKMAEEYIKKQEKATGGKKAKRNDDAEKYVAKYREDSAKCMEEVERTVRESLKGVLAAKRKGATGDGSESDAKRMKIWLGKRKIAGSDSEGTDEDDSDDDEEESEKSVVITDGNNSDSSKKSEISHDSVTGSIREILSSDKGISDTMSEEEKDVVTDESPKSGESTDGCAVHTEAKCVTEITLEGSEERTTQDESLRQEKEVTTISHADNIQQTVSQPPVISDSAEQDSAPSEIDIFANSKLVEEETGPTTAEVPELEKPLNFEEYNSATELEVLGLKRLKSELQERGLKCGGTLQERAARLFLLKTTPLEKLPKKLFAKK